MTLQKVTNRAQQACDTVDGSEIRRSPVEVGSLSHLEAFIYTSLVVSRISEPSIVWWGGAKTKLELGD